jgi:hypothetical protein
VLAALACGHVSGFRVLRRPTTFLVQLFPDLGNLADAAMVARMWEGTELEWVDYYLMIEREFAEGKCRLPAASHRWFPSSLACLLRAGEEATLPIHMSRLEEKIDHVLQGKFGKFDCWLDPASGESPLWLAAADFVCVPVSFSANHQHLMYFLNDALPSFVRALLLRGYVLCVYHAILSSPLSSTVLLLHGTDTCTIRTLRRASTE